MDSDTRLAIIGSGFSGASLAINLHAKCNSKLEILLIGSSAGSRGVAYSTPFSYHLLNVPAGKMSAFPDQPDHFVKWLESRKNGVTFSESGEPLEKLFVPRQVFGEYTDELLEKAKKTAATGTRITQIKNEVTAVVRDGDEWQIQLSQGEPQRVKMLVLATGNEAPAPLIDTLSAERYLNNPWDWDSLRRFIKRSSALLIGTGLTMVDTALCFDEETPDCKLTAVSRRGLYPRAHKWNVVPTSFELQFDDMEGPDAVFRQMWQHLSRHPEDDWRAVCDSLRPSTQKIWQSWSEDQRREFIKVYAPYWGVRRHRIAPEVAARITEMIRNGRLEILEGRLAGAQMQGSDIVVRVQSKKTVRKVTVGSVINCTGPGNPLAAHSRPLFRSLAEQGLVRADPLGLSLDMSDDDEVLNAEGHPSTNFWACGPLSKAAHWEIVAVPDIRNQTAELAQRISSLLQPS